MKMAAPMDWRRELKNRDIFSNLQKKNADPKSCTDSKCLLASKDGMLFVWSSCDSCLLATSLKSSPNSKQTSSRSQSDTSESDFQKLVCSCPPVFDVLHVMLNGSGSHIALFGVNGLTVLELPNRKGNVYGDGQDQIICKSASVAERFLVSSGETLLHAAWHPGSETDSHLMVLTSDSTIRVYDICDPQVAAHTYSLTESGQSFSSPGLRLSAALGDSAVAFDFGSPIKLNRKYEQSTSENTVCIWPVYVLWGNGEVYMLNTSLHMNVPFNKRLVGPLTMHPPAEDNYGSDACSILCLSGSSLPVLVISTCSGRLHHCIVLSQSEDEMNASEFESSQGDNSIMYETPPIPSLYVFESVELELSLTTVSIESDEPVLDDFSCPIRLLSDPSAHDRYHCSHSAGVHTIQLPWLQKFQKFFSAGGNDDLPSISDSQHALVEHLICTKPLPSSSPMPVLGLCIADEHSIAPTLLCLTADMKCLTLPMHRGAARPPPPSLLSEKASPSAVSPLRHLRREPFDVHLRKILQRDASNPLLQTGSTTDLSPQECFRLLSRATQVYREEYIQKLDHAREEISRRVKLLRDQKVQQLLELSRSDVKRRDLNKEAEFLNSKYDECRERQQQIDHRIESLLQKLQQRLPVLSTAEKNMQRELKDMQSSVKTLEAHVKQLKLKEAYQTKQITHHQQSKKATPSSSFSSEQSKKLRGLLKDETDDIADLIKQIKVIKEQVNT